MTNFAIVSTFIFYSALAPGLFAGRTIPTEHFDLTRPVKLARASVYQPPIYCRGSTLTGVKFLQLIQTIIAHGDLTDITFLEKTLGTKFGYSDGSSTGADEARDAKILFLNSQHLLGNPIYVHLYMYSQNSKHLGSGAIASLGFDTPSTFIEDCFHFSPGDISSHLRQEFFGKRFGPGSTSLIYSPEYSSKGKDESKIQLDFSYDLHESSVHGMIIRQFR